jgi:recombination protein RecT
MAQAKTNSLAKKENSAPAIVMPPVESLSFPDMMRDKRVAGQLKQILPENLSIAKMLQTSLILFRNSTSLQACKPMSILSCLVEIAQVGLETDKTRGQAYIVPFKGEATFICGYKGYITLAHRTGQIAHVAAEVVRADEEFDVMYGMNRGIIHKPKFPQSLDEKDWIGSYATMQRLNGGEEFQYVELAKILAIRSRSASYKSGGNSPWKTDPEWMYRKTSIRQLMHLTDLSARDERQSPTRVAIRDDLKERGLLKRAPDADLGALGTDEEFVMVEESHKEMAGATRKSQTLEVEGTFTDEGGKENAGEQGATESGNNHAADSRASGAPVASGGNANQTVRNAPVGRGSAAPQATAQRATAASSPVASKKKITTPQIKDLWKAAETCVSGFNNLQGLMKKTISKRGFVRIEDVTQDKLAEITRELKDGGHDNYPS